MSTRVFEFHLHSTMPSVGLAEGQIKLAGRCGNDRIRLGDEFTAVYWYEPAKSLEEFERHPETRKVGEVSLVVERIEAYRHDFEELDPGLTAALTLKGELTVGEAKFPYALWGTSGRDEPECDADRPRRR